MMQGGGGAPRAAQMEGNDMEHEHSATWRSYDPDLNRVDIHGNRPLKPHERFAADIGALALFLHVSNRLCDAIGARVICAVVIGLCVDRILLPIMGNVAPLARRLPAASGLRRTAFASFPPG